MRILLLTRPICPPWDEGSKNFAYTLAKNARGFQIHLLTSGIVEDLPENIFQHPIYTSAKWYWKQKLRAYLFLAKELFLKGGKDVDVLHSFFTPTNLNVFALKLLIGRKKIKTIQTLATLRDDLYDEEKIKKIIHADYVITYSDYAKDKLEKMGFSSVKRIYPGIDLELFQPAAKNQELLEKFQTNNNDFVINYTGEYVRLGDMDDIISVFTDLALDPRFRGHDNKCRFKLHLAVRVKNEKDRQKRAEVMEKLKADNVLDRVAFIDEGNYAMPDIYNLCDISIFPVRTMAGKFDIPLAVIEAMACAKPVIASNLERLKYFLNEENSLLIAPGDRQALKEKILYLYGNPEARNQLAEAGMKFVRENFDIMKVVSEYEAVYKSMNPTKARLAGGGKDQ